MPWIVDIKLQRLELTATADNARGLSIFNFPRLLWHIHPNLSLSQTYKPVLVHWRPHIPISPPSWKNEVT